VSSLVTAALVTVLASPVPGRAPLTHTSPLTPTGELAPAGTFERTQSFAALHHDLALGVAERIELRLQSPGLPAPVFGGSLSVRTSLLSPASRLRLVLGAGVAGKWIGGADLYLDGAITAGWRGRGWSARATLRALDHRLPRGETGRLLRLATAGFTLDAGRRTILFVDAGELSLFTEASCPGKSGRQVPCRARDGVAGLLAGAWWALSDMDIGLALLVGWRGDAALPVGPLLSFRWQRAL
jgi:hypothetical protein